MIQFDSVSKSFKRTQVLNIRNLRIDRGERVALVGSNGAGKTTLIRCMLGEYVHTGDVTIDGLKPRRYRHKLLARIGFVPQLPPPLKMPVAQLTRFAADLSHCNTSDMEKIALRLGLDMKKFWHQPFVKMSGGQKQKLLIAIALGRKTDILVLDEPAANLDPGARRQFFDLLAERVENTAMLISSHRLDEVASLVNRVIELDQGKVALDDRVADTVALSSVLSCRLRLTRAEPAVSRALTEWRFQTYAADTEWKGTVAGPDRLRFLSMLSRYAALLAEVNLVESSPQSVADMAHNDKLFAISYSSRQPLKN